MNDALVIYCPNESARLHYTLHWLFREQLQINYRITSTKADLTGQPFFISYGEHFDNAISIADSGLLWEKEIVLRDIDTGTWNNIPTLFHNHDYTIPFDVFSAIFFLISRYEEYYDYTPDKHGRYPATESILYKNDWLERPIVDEWITELRKLLRERLSIELQSPIFSFLPTYDIDIAYSYLYKGTKRTAGAYLKDILSGNFNNITERANVLRGSAKDPYDSFDFIKVLHQQNNTRPIYFILSALNTTAFDKNISPLQNNMQQLIKSLANEGSIGLHPSYFSGNSSVFANEKNMLENIIGQPISISRQHYIRMNLPGNYQELILNGIVEDYSMGYATCLGFRAGTGQSFPWYNLAKEEVTALRVQPFCFMDTTARYEMNLSADEAFKSLHTMAGLLKQSGSLLITVFHNFSLGTDKQWEGWKEKYALFLNEYTGTNADK